jgi:hypothetical protein
MPGVAGALVVSHAAACTGFGRMPLKVQQRQLMGAQPSRSQPGS